MPLIVDKYILLTAKKRKKSTKTKHTNKKKHVYSCIPTAGKWREEPGTKRANNLIKLIRRISVRSVLEI